MTAAGLVAQPFSRRRDRQREETRRDLALAAFDLATTHGLANVRVPDIAAAAGVSTRTFNNYFSSKEEAITWPAKQRASHQAVDLLNRPADEPLADALLATITGRYGNPPDDGLPPNWLRGFRALVAAEPSLHGEYLKASDAAERALTEAIASRLQTDGHEIRAQVIAAMVVGAERAAVLHWIRQPGKQEPLVETVRAAVQYAVAGLR
jgi:AcrR family transcriptional regulator